ncbi:Bug family tripartite tricarboxylate transporter substrate binding protein [Reyranella sp.]|uniref:Bug family tripartite tricarboxylate transporter substrate binding protein n=1 Tax=Reyranella sp. TaxID=1929291 RepID=UPI003D10D869
MRRRWLLMSAAVLARPAAAADWPQRSVTFVVPFGAGSSPDVIGRLLAERLSAIWGQPVIVQNVPGAAATIGVDRIAKGPADGYTVGLTGDAAMVVRVSMEPPPPYNPLTDIAPITLLVRTRNILVVHPAVPATTLPELIALARAEPGKLSYAHSGAGFSTHLGMEMLKQAAKIDITGVPYGNEGQMIADLSQNRVQMAIQSGPAMIGRVRAGELRAIAVTSRDRSPSLPQVPTVAEQGFPGFEAVAWFGVITRSGIPGEQLARIHRDVTQVLGDPTFTARLEDMGLVPVGLGPQEFSELLPKEIARMQAVLAPLGLKAR